MDPREAKLVNVYASALLDVAFEKGVHAEVLQELKGVVKAVLSVPRLGVMLHLGDARRAAIVSKVFGRHVSDVTLNLLQAVMKRRRAALLPGILKAYTEGYHERQGEVVASITTAVPLEEPQRANIVARLKKRFQKDIVVEERVDPRIIGGIVVRVGDLRIDGSLRTQLDAIEARLLAARIRDKD